MPPSCKLTTRHVTETAGIEVFFGSQKMRALSREQTVELRIVPENQDRSQSANQLNSHLAPFIAHVDTSGRYPPGDYILVG